MTVRASMGRRKQDMSGFPGLSQSDAQPARPPPPLFAPSHLPGSCRGWRLWSRGPSPVTTRATRWTGTWAASRTTRVSVYSACIHPYVPTLCDSPNELSASMFPPLCNCHQPHPVAPSSTLTCTPGPNPLTWRCRVAAGAGVAAAAATSAAAAGPGEPRRRCCCCCCCGRCSRAPHRDHSRRGCRLTQQPTGPRR